MFAVVCCLVVGVVLVSELVQALWFEDVGFLNEQLLDTPVGRFSIRQMCLFLVFVDLVLKVVVGGGVFLVGAALFSRKVRTIAPELHLLYVARQFLLVKLKGSKQEGNLSEEKSSMSLLLSGSLGVPVKVVGVLKSLTTGEILSGKNFKVSINNTVHSKGATDVDGCFCVYFVPDRFGVFQVEIQPEDSSEHVQRIMVNVNPKSDEEKQNAKTTTS